MPSRSYSTVATILIAIALISLPIRNTKGQCPQRITQEFKGELTYGTEITKIPIKVAIVASALGLCENNPLTPGNLLPCKSILDFQAKDMSMWETAVDIREKWTACGDQLFKIWNGTVPKPDDIPQPMTAGCEFVHRFEIGHVEAQSGLYQFSMGNAIRGKKLTGTIHFCDQIMLENTTNQVQGVEFPVHISGGVFGAECFGKPDNTWGKAKLVLAGFVDGHPVKDSISVESISVIPEQAFLDSTQIYYVVLAPGTTSIGVDLDIRVEVEVRATGNGMICGAATAGFDAPGSISIGNLSGSQGGPLPEGLLIYSGVDSTVYADTRVFDTDGDGINDNRDNCPTAANPNQADADSDGIGDACDACQNSDNMRLWSWEKVQLILGVDGPASWLVDTSGTSVVQTANSSFSVYLEPANRTRYYVDGSLLCTDSYDDDYMGFVFNYKDTVNWLSLQVSKKGSFHDGILYGFAIFKNNFANKVDSSFGSDKGWETGKTYQYHLVVTPGKARISIYQDTTLVWKTLIADSAIDSGRLGFVNVSQPDVRYSASIGAVQPLFVPDTIRLLAEAFSPKPAKASLTLTYETKGCIQPSWNVREDESWLSLNPTSGSSDPGKIIVTADASNLDSGLYATTIAMYDTLDLYDTTRIPVMLTITRATTTCRFMASGSVGPFGDSVSVELRGANGTGLIAKREISNGQLFTTDRAATVYQAFTVPSLGDTLSPSPQGFRFRLTKCGLEICRDTASAFTLFIDGQQQTLFRTEEEAGCPVCDTLSPSRPVITCPGDTVRVELAEPGTVKILVPITDADRVLMAFATWEHDTLSFTADSSGLYTFLPTAFNACGIAQCPIFVRARVGCGFHCGDFNGDCDVDLADVVFLINYIFVHGSPAPLPIENGDADCSGSINIADAVFLVNYIFSHGPRPCQLCE
jgi:hypothetical protein